MSDLERAEAASLLSTLTSALSPDVPFEVDGRAENGHAAKGALLTKLVRGLAGAAEMSDVTAAAKAEMYADAVEDLPAWAVDHAIKRWARGEVPANVEENPKFAFPPAPATLRALASLELDLPRRYARMMTDLLAAIPLEDALNPDHVAASTALAPAMRRM